ncbi:MAG: YfcE family phosphodiesterase [Candidatus Altiarchaeales archaeon HGW-Altiarchaeales-1]|nr:MAG: YfcE family phosphodiesterase [Candidatus Altiarchaeales archaeon HGW-Altiarchaeales-2]PKP59967.1 MAG: YfcE family phosphodiesterase [Candidatus Altiarchaeales archaeon HGW-Altiarchaeales-1]
MIKIGIISDTHILRGMEKISKSILNEFSNVDKILHAGDFVSIDVLNHLQNIAPTIGVRGNMDQFNILPAYQELKIEGLKIGLIHNAGSYREDPVKNPLNLAKSKGVDVLVYGHTHTRFMKKAGDILLLNPGSPTLADQKSFMTAKINGKDISVEVFEL